MVDISQERLKYHEWMAAFIRMLVPGMLVYDIGKSHLHDYRKTFERFDYKTIDRDRGKAPDILLDIEGLTCSNVNDYLPQADAALCNGVVEQCDDPMQMIRSCNALLKMDGILLFGSVLLGYPPHTHDRFRFTHTGADAALKRYGFDIKDVHVMQRNGVPSYMYSICRKVKNV